jgi:hypothetical protein
VLRKVGGTPAHERDGELVYEGKLAAYTDVAATPGETYTYAAFARDLAYNASAPALAQVTVVTCAPALVSGRELRLRAEPPALKLIAKDPAVAVGRATTWR